MINSFFEKKVIIISGSTRGIGFSIAKHFLQRGANVIINGRTQDSCQKAFNSLSQELQQRCFTFSGNITDEEKAKELIDVSLKKYNKVDVLINNAGITKDNLIMRMKTQDWDDVLELNLKSVFLLSKFIIRPMLKQKWGRIINMSSVVGLSGNPGQTNYAASKAGIIAFSQSLAKEVASKGITVNSIAPGFIETDMTDQMNEEMKSYWENAIPMKKLGNVEDIAFTCEFLASDKASYITGQTISVNGGLYM